MRTYACTCGSRLFFDNTQCLNCGRKLGWCPDCNQLCGLDPAGAGVWTCGNCGTALKACHNYTVEAVCNRMVHADSEQTLCRACRHNRTVPDTGVAGNREKWARLESAKRRLFYLLDRLGLPYGTEAEGFEPPLTFDFKADMVVARGAWTANSPVERVYTGHASGRITINLDEADDIEREKRRIAMKEAQRTLVGHFRHEIAHYYWELLVHGHREQRFIELFGNHEKPSYREALDRHYREGPPNDWQHTHISAYATMHPWEDFAETFATWLDIVAILDTATHWRLSSIDPWRADVTDMLAGHQRLGLALNEINRELGLIDPVPEILVPPVIDKLCFIHELVRATGNGQSATAADLTGASIK